MGPPHLPAACPLRASMSGRGTAGGPAATYSTLLDDSAGVGSPIRMALTIAERWWATTKVVHLAAPGCKRTRQACVSALLLVQPGDKTGVRWRGREVAARRAVRPRVRPRSSPATSWPCGAPGSPQESGDTRYRVGIIPSEPAPGRFCGPSGPARAPGHRRPGPSGRPRRRSGRRGGSQALGGRENARG